MNILNEETKYVPGFYRKKKQNVSELANAYINEWEKKRLALKKKKEKPSGVSPTICISRKTGVGALEIAEILSEKLGVSIFDKEIIEYIANKANLRDKTVSYFDECYPGKVNELIKFLFGEKSFTERDYIRHLFSSVLSLSCSGSSILLGRGAHLILPRDKVLAVRIISSDEFRVKRIVNLLKISEKDAQSEIERKDKEQKAFFKKVFKKKEVTPYEFDMVINCDYILKSDSVAEIISSAFKAKFA